MDSSLPAHYSRFANYRSYGEWLLHLTRFGVPPEMDNKLYELADSAIINITRTVLLLAMLKYHLLAMWSVHDLKL